MRIFSYNITNWPSFDFLKPIVHLASTVSWKKVAVITVLALQVLAAAPTPVNDLQAPRCFIPNSDLLHPGEIRQFERQISNSLLFYPTLHQQLMYLLGGEDAYEQLPFYVGTLDEGLSAPVMRGVDAKGREVLLISYYPLPKEGNCLSDWKPSVAYFVRNKNKPDVWTSLESKTPFSNENQLTELGLKRLALLLNGYTTWYNGRALYLQNIGFI